MNLTPTNEHLLGHNPVPHKRNPSRSVMVRLKRLDTLRLNQRIKVKDYGYGTIRFLGCVHFAQGLFVGVELDEPKGKHDGSYHGTRYFTTKEMHGVLVKQHKVELLDIDTARNTAIIDEFGAFSDDDAQKYTNHIANKISMNYDELLFNELMHSKSDEMALANQASPSQHRLISEEVMSELQSENKSLRNQMDEYMKSVDDLELKIASLESENSELKQEKLHFENEMNAKIQELEDQLNEIRAQLNTKDEVLKKQIATHSSTKQKFRQKIIEHEELKQKNADTVQLILYGDNLKDDIIAQHKKQNKNIQNEMRECSIEMERLQTETQNKLKQKIEEWIFDYGEGGYLNSF